MATWPANLPIASTRFLFANNRAQQTEFEKRRQLAAFLFGVRRLAVALLLGELSGNAEITKRRRTAALQSCESSFDHLTCCAMSFKIINPAVLGNPSGYSNGLLAPATGKLLFVSGQVAWNREQKITSNDFVEQFDQALANFVSVVLEAGGSPVDVVRLIMYVTDINEYRARTREIGDRYRHHFGKHFPAMVLVEVKGLLDDAAKVEIEGIALLNQ